MRERGATASHERMTTAARRIVMLALSVWLVLSSLPLGRSHVAAAPPDAKRVAAFERVAPTGTEAEDGSVAIPDEPRRERNEAPERRAAPAPASETDSVRPRGLEAPVQLRQVAAEPEPESPVAEASDPGDGEPRASRASGKNKKARDRNRNKEKARKEQRVSLGLRVWPMRAGTYSFSQAFGCVPQIAHFYQPGDGCPAEAPVIHHGIDLAAPEGTPFYAAASGWVTEAGYDREVGVANTRIIIQHEGPNDGYATEYLHWIASYVEVGDYVEAGDNIGEVGSVGYSTGPHLHFTVTDLDNGGNVDPIEWLPEDADQEGYRGRKPNAHDAMRLPPGTTAGVPEFADPAPPPPPVREEVPETRPTDNRGRDRADRQEKRDRKERKKGNKGKKARNGGKNARANGGEDASANTKVKKGKNKERTRTRERNKDGQRNEKSARGENNSGKRSKKENRKATSEKDADSSGKNTRDAKRSEKKSGKRNNANDNAVDQRESNGGKNKNNGGGNKSKNNTDGGRNTNSGGGGKQNKKATQPQEAEPAAPNEAPEDGGADGQDAMPPALEPAHDGSAMADDGGERKRDSRKKRKGDR